MIEFTTSQCDACVKRGSYYLLSWKVHLCGRHLTTFYLGLVYTGWMEP